jgi:hypothetical protein
MSTEKKLGIWMDHSSAHLTEYSTSDIQSTTIESAFTHVEKVEAISKSENFMHNKEQHEQSEYYKKLGDVIRNYDEVILFGPTDAKLELFNTLKDDHLFEKIKIQTRQTDKMTESQQQTFVMGYFSKHL